MPDQLPTNYNMRGEVTGYGGKGHLIVLLILNWLIFTLLTWLSLRPLQKGGALRFMRFNSIRIGKWRKQGDLTDRAFAANPVAANNVVIDLLMGMKLVITPLFSYLIIQSAAGAAPAMWIAWVPLVLLMVFVFANAARLMKIAEG